MLIIREEWLLKAPSKKSKINEASTYKKITLSSTILFILLKNTKNKTKGDTCAKKPIRNNNTNVC